MTKGYELAVTHYGYSRTKLLNTLIIGVPKSPELGYSVCQFTSAPSAASVRLPTQRDSRPSSSFRTSLVGSASPQVQSTRFRSSAPAPRAKLPTFRPA